ncbi:MAG: ABC transporter, partial [Clostridiales bacterium]|nr:ABC transporter [Clostridiales bacterium]
RKKYVNEIGAVFGQKSQLIWDIPPADSFQMNKAIYGIEDSVYKKRLGELTELLELQDIIVKPTRVLSLGERMKCEFIMAMLHGPKIVFLDEPTIGLDVIAKTKIREFIKSVNAAGTTFILTTHDLEDVKQLAHRVIIINHGKKVFDDTLGSLQTNLGEKKIVDLILREPFNGYLPENAKITAQKSELEITLEADVADMDISAFIEGLSRNLGFTDISIRELPMEQIITQIYNSQG